MHVQASLAASLGGPSGRSDQSADGGYLRILRLLAETPQAPQTPQTHPRPPQHSLAEAGPVDAEGEEATGLRPADGGWGGGNGPDGSAAAAYQEVLRD